ncbi:phosphatase PAP2 family protein [Geobacter sp. SVR]|uniref:phosphatase PAP2 family protein n=1 Tax=Geobacter sp. SVR TaxID=2495594 RepID=UPI00143EFAEF|nr:phosphatase PAP2 family protein [Geobacter sp. SVR]BCS52177.1 hypothetical protein GSVR_04850 [Geobacter sp. SVR]GCF86632.1 hypothetical protein GSbR_32320 [Geobacter sp. SVR]
MRKSATVEFIAVTMVLLTATALIAVTGLDMKAAQLFYVPGTGFPYGDLQPGYSLYRYGVWPAYLLAGVSLLVFSAGFFLPGLRRHRRPALFIVLLLALGPGLLVNTVFKDHWGRPRPRQVAEFGGSNPFHQPWQNGNRTDCKSFPCGHASAAFYLMAPYFVLRRANRRQARAWLSLGIVYGTLMGIERIAQGGHFVSDVLWSCGVVTLAGLILAATMRPHIRKQPPSGGIQCLQGENFR